MAGQNGWPPSENDPATPMTTIKVSKGGSVQVASSDAEREGEANIVTFIPATETNITNQIRAMGRPSR